MTDPPLDPGTSIGRFEVVRLLGRGGFGGVYEARDTELGRHVALKVVRADRPGSSLLEMFRSEAEAAARLNHPNVVTIHDHGVHEGEPYLVLELLAGETLARRLARGPLPPEAAAAILAQVCRGLVHAHAAGVLHRDLKPSNVFLRDDGQVKILDFGLARVGQALTRPGGTPAYMAPEQWRGAEQDQRADVFSCGAILFEMLCGCLPYAVSSDARDDLEASLGTLGPRMAGVSPRLITICERALARDPRDRTPSAQALLDSLLAVEGNGCAAATAQPYRFLDQFTETDAAWFFGREAEILRLEQMLAARPLVAVVGHSGAGKSSLIHAGLVPRLRQSGRWTIVAMRPGGEPLARLHERLVEVCGEARVTPLVPDAAALVDAPGRAGLLLRRHAGEERRSILLVVDQLEELVTHGASARVRRAFAQALLSIADDPHGPLRVAVGLRDDFLVRLSRNTELHEALLPGMVLLGAPSAEGLSDALRAPAARLGYDYEPGLVHAIVTAVAGEAAPLPLLQLAASRLWEQRDETARLLTRTGLDAAGGVAGILAAHANETLERLPDVVLPRRILCELVTDEGTRRRVRRDELCARFADPRAANQALEVLVSGRLISAYRSDRGEWVELAHESLITGWGELRAWLAEDRSDRQFRDRVLAAATLWAERGRPSELLWRGDTLDEALRWQRRFAGAMSEREQAFIGRSEAGLRGARRVRRGVFFVAAAVAVVGTVTSSVAVHAYRAAARQEQLREITRRAAAADDPLLGALIIAELAGHPEPPGGLAAAVQVAARPIPIVEHGGHPGIVSGCFWSPDDQSVASATHMRPPDPTESAGDGGIYIWRSDGSGKPVVLIAHGWIAFSRDGQRLLTSGDEKAVRIWRVDGTGAPVVRRLPARIGLEPSFTPDGHKVLTATPDARSVWLWSTDGRGGPIVFPMGDVDPSMKRTIGRGSAELSGDGSLVLVAGEGLRLWSANGLPIASRPGRWREAHFTANGTRIVAWNLNHEVWTWGADLTAPVRLSGVTWPVAFSADGRRMAYDNGRLGVDVAATDGTAPVVRLEPRASILSGGLRDYGFGPTFNPDGSRVIVGTQLFFADGVGRPLTLAHSGSGFFSHDGTRVLTCGPASDKIRIWAAGDPPGTRSFHGHQATVVSAVASPDGRTLLTGSLDGTVRLWPVGGGSPIILGEPGGPTRGEAIFRPDGRRVAAAGSDNRVRVWSVDGGEPLVIDVPHQATGLAFSPDGALLAAGGLVLRSDGSGTVARLAMQGAPEDMAFSPDGSRLVAAGYRSPTLVWRTDDWTTKPVALAGAPAGVHQIAFHPRGDRIMTGSFDDQLQLWSLDGHELASQAGGRAVAFSPDGERIAVGLPDGTARITRLDGSGDPVVIRGHPGAVTSVAFTPDGRWLATTAEGDPIAHLWLVDWAELTRALRAATTACLTPEQRMKNLDESPATARAAWDRCERRNGRRP